MDGKGQRYVNRGMDRSIDRSGRPPRRRRSSSHASGVPASSPAPAPSSAPSERPAIAQITRGSRRRRCQPEEGARALAKSRLATGHQEASQLEAALALALPAPRRRRVLNDGGTEKRKPSGRSGRDCFRSSSPSVAPLATDDGTDAVASASLFRLVNRSGDGESVGVGFGFWSRSGGRFRIDLAS